jgi:hypothetical protein
MSGRIDVLNDRLTYSCNCGWIDKVHAGLGSYSKRHPDKEEGMRNLWDQLSSERNVTQEKLQGLPAFEVHWKQSMQILIGNTFGARSSYRGSYLVQRSLPLPRKKAIALRVMLDVAYKFEAIQATSPYSFWNDSGFSQEDLVSDMIAFYSVVDGIGDEHVYSMCRVVSKAASLKVWDTHMTKGLGASKNTSFVNPVYHSCDECAAAPMYPVQFTSIEPASYDRDFVPLTKSSGASGLYIGSK